MGGGRESTSLLERSEQAPARPRIQYNANVVTTRMSSLAAARRWQVVSPIGSLRYAGRGETASMMHSTILSHRFCFALYICETVNGGTSRYDWWARTRIASNMCTAVRMKSGFRIISSHMSGRVLMSAGEREICGSKNGDRIMCPPSSSTSPEQSGNTPRSLRHSSRLHLPLQKAPSPVQTNKAHEADNHQLKSTAGSHLMVQATGLATMRRNEAPSRSTPFTEHALSCSPRSRVASYHSQSWPANAIEK